ncbi:MAG: hypothetical protein GC157_04685 [Frankiales bacterium]|nr:hypothetical protein [Frankiales bacterium]
MSPVLDQLERWEAAIHRVGGPGYYVGQPGLRPDQVRDLLASHGLQPSPELVTWFTWHDGGGAPHAQFTPPSPYCLCSLESALASRAFLLSTNADREHVPPERQYRQQWLPIMSDPDFLVYDCTDGSIWSVSAWDEEFSRPVSESLEACVRTFCDALDSGRYQLNGGQIEPAADAGAPGGDSVYLLM